MSDKRDVPAHATYDQRYGSTPLPELMKPGEISLELRNDLEDLLDRTLKGLSKGHFNHLTNEGKDVMLDVLPKFFKQSRRERTRYENEYTLTIINDLSSKMKSNWPPERTLGFFELLMDAYSPIREEIYNLLKNHNAPYHVIEEEGTFRFHPISLEAERDLCVESYAV